MSEVYNKVWIHRPCGVDSYLFNDFKEGLENEGFEVHGWNSAYTIEKNKAIAIECDTMLCMTPEHEWDKSVRKMTFDSNPNYAATILEMLYHGHYERGDVIGVDEDYTVYERVSVKNNVEVTFECPDDKLTLMEWMNDNLQFKKRQKNAKSLARMCSVLDAKKVPFSTEENYWSTGFSDLTIEEQSCLFSLKGNDGALSFSWVDPSEFDTNLYKEERFAIYYDTEFRPVEWGVRQGKWWSDNDLVWAKRIEKHNENLKPKRDLVADLEDIKSNPIVPTDKFLIDESNVFPKEEIQEHIDFLNNQKQMTTLECRNEFDLSEYDNMKLILSKYSSNKYTGPGLMEQIKTKNVRYYKPLTWEEMAESLNSFKVSTHKYGIDPYCIKSKSELLLLSSISSLVR
jgi:hypothetical protein